MTLPEDRSTPRRMPQTERDVLERMRSDRSQLAEERRTRREQRRQHDRRFAAVVLICAAVCFVVGVAIAMAVWRPQSPPASQSDAAGHATPAEVVGSLDAAAARVAPSVRGASVAPARSACRNDYASPPWQIVAHASSHAGQGARSGVVETLKHS